MAVAAGFLFLALLAGAAVYFWPTRDGVVRVEINDDNIVVEFTRTGLTVRGAGKQDIHIEPGEHGLKIRYGGVEFATDKFILPGSGMVLLRVERLPGKIQVVTADGKVIGEGILPPPAGVHTATVRLEIADPDVQIAFDRNGPTIRGTDPKRDLTLPPDAHRLKVRRGDVEFETEPFELRKNETVNLRVNRLLGKVLVVTVDGKVIGSKELPAPPAALDRIVPDPAFPLLAGHTEPIWQVRFLSDSRRVASAGWDGKVRVWDVTTGQELRACITNHQDQILSSLAVSADDRLLAAGGSYAGVFLWEQAEKPLRLMPLEAQTTIHALAFTPDRNRLLAGAADGSLYVFHVPTGTRLHRYPVFEKQGISGLRLLPDGNRVVCVTVGKTRAVLWDLAKGQEIRPFPCPEPVEGLALDRDGRTLFLGSSGGKIYLWDVETGQGLGALTGHTSRVKSLFPLPGGRLLTTSEDKTVRLWDVTLGKEIDRHMAESYVVSLADVSPDGRRLVAGAGWRTFLHMERFKDYRLRQFLVPAAR
jgi:hypothetical protein